MAIQVQGALADLLRNIRRLERRLDALQAAETAAGGGGGAGTVTSVALSMPALFSVSGSPVTTTGTLTATLATQTANYLWAGPTSGGAAAPTFRAMVTADIPDAIVTYAKIQNVATARMLGRSTAGAGVVEEIAIGTGLSLSAGTLASTVAGTVTSVALSLPAFLTVSGSPVTGSGTLAATLATQTANFGFFGPTSGAAAAPTFRALVLADLPQVWDLSRTLAGATTSYVEIGSFDVTNGAHNLRVSVSVNGSGHVIAKQYFIATKYNQTGGAWHYALPVADSGFYNYDFDVIVAQSATSVALRLYQRAGNANSDTHYVRIENVGISTDAFTAASASGTMTAPTVALASSMDVKAKALYLTRTIPTTVGNYVGIGNFAGTPLGHILEVDISNSDGGFAVAKHHVFASTYAEASSNAIVAPISSTGPYSSNDYALVAVQSGSGVTLYLLRTQGTTAGTATVAIRYVGAPSVAFTESTSTGSMSVPTIYYPSAVFTQADGGARVLGGYLSGNMDTMTYAGTITLDVTLGNLHKTTTVDATGNATINASGVGVAGQHMWILIVNDATSGKVITFGTNFKSTGTLTGTTSKQATIHFISDGVSWSEVARSLAL